MQSKRDFRHLLERWWVHHSEAHKSAQLKFWSYVQAYALLRIKEIRGDLR